MKRTLLPLIATTSILALSGCQSGKLPNLKAYNPFIKGVSESSQDVKASVGEASETTSSLPTLADMIGSAGSKVSVDAGFAVAMRDAISRDPYVLAAKSDALSLQARTRSTRSQKDFNFSGTLLGGVEDVTDKRSGVAAIVSAKRSLYDGGKLDAQIAADEFTAQAAEYKVVATQNERGVTLAHAWIELERYRELKEIIDSRLEVLDPLLSQLEAVAKSGMGDASQIAAAQRTVSLIRVTETDVSERFEQAKVNFVNLFGKLPQKVTFDSAKLAKAVPAQKPAVLAETAPALLARYNEYRAAEAQLASIKAQGKFNVGFEAKLQRPFGASDYGSDETIGLILTKTFYRGDQLTSQIDNADAAAKSKAEQVRATYVTGERTLESARQMISSMDMAITQARENANNARDEISYLRKQLIIGGSTLDSVLSAEARLYDAESKEIGFVAERKKAQVTILGATGVLTNVLGIK